MKQLNGFDFKIFEINYLCYLWLTLKMRITYFFIYKTCLLNTVYMRLAQGKQLFSFYKNGDLHFRNWACVQILQTLWIFISRAVLFLKVSSYFTVKKLFIFNMASFTSGLLFDFKHLKIIFLNHCYFRLFSKLTSGTSFFSFF